MNETSQLFDISSASYNSIADDDMLLEKTRAHAHEHLQTLVRMHLSFCLELSTIDEILDVQDSPVPTKSNNDKLLLSLKKKSTKTPVKQKEECPFEIYTPELLQNIDTMIDYLHLPSNICQEGLFRRHGKLKSQQELRASLLCKQKLDLNASNYSVHEVASVFKNILAETPEPLLTKAHYHFHEQIAELTDAQRQVKCLQLLFLLLPVENYQLLKKLLTLLHDVSLHADVNKMTASNLGTMFAPHILCPRKMSAEVFQASAGTLASMVAFMIQHSPTLFSLPKELHQDLALYWQEKKAASGKDSVLKNTPSGKENESSPAVQTTITFVDRQLCAKVIAEDGDPTRTALAQLYAYVQSQPESTKKRKLVHRFNRESGNGTPRTLNVNQSLNMSVDKNTLGGSLKKHLFRSSSKRPKPSSLSTTVESPSHSPQLKPPSKPTLPASTFQTPVSGYIRHPAFTPKRVLPMADLDSPQVGGTLEAGVALSTWSLLQEDGGALTAKELMTELRPCEESEEETMFEKELKVPEKRNEEKENEVLSPLSQSAQHWPITVRQTICTPRSRKPILALSNVSLALTPTVESLEDDDCDAGAEDTCSQSWLFEKGDIKDETETSQQSDVECGEKREQLIQNETNLSSPFVRYMEDRGLHILSPSPRKDNVSLSTDLGSPSDSMLHFLDGNAESPNKSCLSPTAEQGDVKKSPTTKPAVLNKQIIFETSL